MPSTIETQAPAKLTLPLETYTLYESQAREKKQPLDAVFSERLNACVGHVSTKGIYVSDTDRAAIEALTGKNVSSASDLIGALRYALRIKVAGGDVTLKPEVVERLKSRCFERDFPRWLADLVKKNLEQFVGLG